MIFKQDAELQQELMKEQVEFEKIQHDEESKKKQEAQGKTIVLDVSKKTFENLQEIGKNVILLNNE